MKFIKASLLLVLLSASSLVAAATDLGLYSGSLSPPSPFDLSTGPAALSNDTYSWLGGVTEKSDFKHMQSLTLGANNGVDSGGGPLNYTSTFGNIIVPSQIDNSNFSLRTNNDVQISQISGSNFGSFAVENYHLKMTGTSLGAVTDAYGMPMIVSAILEPEQWVMIVLGLFLVGIQVARTKRVAEPLGLDAEGAQEA